MADDHRTTLADSMPWVAIMVMWLAIAAAISSLAAFAPPSFADGSWLGITVIIIALICGAAGTRQHRQRA